MRLIAAKAPTVYRTTVERSENTAYSPLEVTPFMFGGENWVVQNIVNALNTWNNKMAEIWQLITQSPQAFKGGAVWRVIEGIHGSLVAIGLALLVLFFVMGIAKSTINLTELKRPEQAVRFFLRFVLAKAAVTYGMDLIFREGALWRREEEVHEEYAYEPRELTDYLHAAGFRDVKQYGELKLRPPKPGEGRIFFAARKDL